MPCDVQEHSRPASRSRKRLDRTGYIVCDARRVSTRAAGRRVGRAVRPRARCGSTAPPAGRDRHQRGLKNNRERKKKCKKKDRNRTAPPGRIPLACSSPSLLDASADPTLKTCVLSLVPGARRCGRSRSPRVARATRCPSLQPKIAAPASSAPSSSHISFPAARQHRGAVATAAVTTTAPKIITERLLRHRARATTAGVQTRATYHAAGPPTSLQRPTLAARVQQPAALVLEVAAAETRACRCSPCFCGLPALGRSGRRSPSYVAGTAVRQACRLFSSASPASRIIHRPQSTPQKSSSPPCPGLLAGPTDPNSVLHVGTSRAVVTSVGTRSINLISRPPRAASLLWGRRPGPPGQPRSPREAHGGHHCPIALASSPRVLTWCRVADSGGEWSPREGHRTAPDISSGGPR